MLRYGSAISRFPAGSAGAPDLALEESGRELDRIWLARRP